MFLCLVKYFASPGGRFEGCSLTGGNGKDISIWQHRWLSFASSGYVISPQWDQSLQVVSDLFLLGTRRWDEELLDCNFYPWD